jgi:proline iminopeptidase
LSQASAATDRPRSQGLLDVGDGHRIHWQEWGAATGRPAVVLHGGPGSGCASRSTRFFDLTKYRVILFDQRGCGRSSPSASSDTAALRANTTQHLVADIELLRKHLGVARWLVLGGSWGATLGLAYAEQHPQVVSELVLFSIVTTTRREVQWVTRDAGRLFPAEWQRFRDGVPPDARDGNLAEAYNELLLDADPAVCERAAREWCAWEDRHVRTHAASLPDPRYQDPSFRLCFARLVTHYWRHAAWLEEGRLLRDAERLIGIPGALIHGALDFSSPLDIAWQLAQVWSDCELVVVTDEGHDGGASMTERISSATQRYAR